ncbi:MAG: primosomal protein N' [Alphaproteobacteria bacterium]|nr:primosomal protein N' [Alphaproteobacteria bacterium]
MKIEPPEKKNPDEKKEISEIFYQEKIFEILPIGPFDRAFLYLSKDELIVGDIVEIPFGKRSILGLVLGNAIDTDIELKYVSKRYKINIGKDYCDFLDWVASYTLIPRGNILKMILCEISVFHENKRVNFQKEENFGNVVPIELNEEQQIAYEALKKGGPRPYLLHGVTGSGKTEVYLSIVHDIFQQNKQILILLPEIALTEQLASRIEKYFGMKPLIWNSSITPKNRKIAWMKAVSGEKCVIIGARSALFLPFKNLGIIVVDEEHDASYKQEEGGFYNARDMAIVLGHIKKISIILSSATPSLESYINAINGKYGYVCIKSRFGIAKPVHIELIDMRQCKFEENFISPYLLDNIKETVGRGEQALIYLNRRGYSPVTLCKSCGNKLSCSNCSSWLVYHKNIGKAVCHYCGYKIDIPKKCGYCGSENSYIQFGPGIERIFEEISSRIHDAKIEQVSSDNISSEKSLIELRNRILNNEVNIIIGTQILAKGHHFPNITLVGVVDGDFGLNCADLRSAEKTYQLIQQVAGRAGRADKPGKILIQTFNPEHSLYSALVSNNVQNFINLETLSRKKNNLPPFTKFASVIISGTNRELTELTAKKLAASFPINGGIELFGPTPAPLFLLRGRTRWRILLKSSKKIAMSKFIKNWISSQKLPKNIKIQIDIDPITFL